MHIRFTDQHPVYNCRSPNSWALDLALTATHFPHCGLTYAILFGCPISVEQKLLYRIKGARAEADHPLLLVGIFVELERARHLRVIHDSIGEIEKGILAMDSDPRVIEAIPASQREERNREKRRQWLSTAFLRNKLLTWNLQLRCIVSHMDELSSGGSRRQVVSSDPVPGTSHDIAEVHEKEAMRERHRRRVHMKIRNRVHDIVDEYEDKIRDCTMRVDNMAMATQWVSLEAEPPTCMDQNRPRMQHSCRI